MIYLYAIVESGTRAPDSPGIDEQPVEVVPLDEVAVLCSTHPPREFPPEPGLLWRHDQILERAMADGPLLPVRFGTTFADSEGLRAALAGRGPDFRRHLEELRGCVELAVRVSVPDPPGEVPADGRAYIEERIALRRELAAAAARALAPLEPLARDSRRRAPVASGHVMTASYLVPTGEVGRFADEVRRLGRSSQDFDMSCTGPWAPYSFVGGETR